MGEHDELSSNDQDVFDALLDPEIQTSLHTLITQLPKLAMATTLMAKACDVASEVLTDGDMLEGMTHSVRQKTLPIQDKVKSGVSIIQEAKLRAATDHSRVNVFTLLKLLKDPTVQKNLHFVQALLAVMAERDNAIH